MALCSFARSLALARRLSRWNSSEFNERDSDCEVLCTGNISETCFDPFFSKSRTRRSCFASEARATPFHLIPQMDVAVSSPPSPDSVHSPLPRFAEHTFACAHDGCDKRFFRRCDLKKHWRVHTGTKLFACDLEGCGKKFAWSSHLTTHKRMHTNVRPYTCDHEGCAKRFSQASNLRTHKRTHTGDKPIACDVEGCGMRFMDSAHQMTHKRTHTGEKPYACDYEGCGKNFSQLSNLKSHRSRHTGDRLYACDNDGCDKNFRTLSDRANHRRTHTDTKPYAHNRYAKGLAALVAASALQDFVPISKVQATLELKVWLQSVNAMCQ